MCEGVVQVIPEGRELVKGEGSDRKEMEGCHVKGGKTRRDEVLRAPPRPPSAPAARYAPPDPRGIFPLSANILDPVRASIVVDGPAHIAEVGRTPAPHFSCRPPPPLPPSLPLLPP